MCDGNDTCGDFSDEGSIACALESGGELLHPCTACSIHAWASVSAPTGSVKFHCMLLRVTNRLISHVILYTRYTFCPTSSCMSTALAVKFPLHF